MYLTSLGIATPCFAALKVGVHCHNCLEIPVLWYIAVGRDEEYDLEAVGGGWYSCDFDSLGEESKVRGLEMTVRRCPLLERLREKGEKYKGENWAGRFAVIYTTVHQRKNGHRISNTDKEGNLGNQVLESERKKFVEALFKMTTLKR